MNVCWLLEGRFEGLLQSREALAKGWCARACKGVITSFAFLEGVTVPL
jgi:hypothetical protein